MTHLTINPRLLELKMINREPHTFYIFQLAGVAHGANGLIAGGTVEFLPFGRVGTLAFRPVNHLPKIDPPLLQQIVLNGKDMNLSIR